jgi:hypothetical protein
LSKRFSICRSFVRARVIVIALTRRGPWFTLTFCGPNDPEGLATGWFDIQPVPSGPWKARRHRHVVDAEAVDIGIWSSEVVVH